MVSLKRLDSGFRRKDEETPDGPFYETINSKGKRSDSLGKVNPRPVAVFFLVYFDGNPEGFG